MVAVDDEKKLLFRTPPHYPLRRWTTSCCLGLIAGVLDLKVEMKLERRVDGVEKTMKGYR